MRNIEKVVSRTSGKGEFMKEMSVFMKSNKTSGLKYDVILFNKWNEFISEFVIDKKHEVISIMCLFANSLLTSSISVKDVIKDSRTIPFDVFNIISYVIQLFLF